MFTRSRAANTTTVRRAEAASSPTVVLCVQPKQSATDASSTVKWEYSADTLQNKMNRERYAWDQTITELQRSAAHGNVGLVHS